MGSLLLSAGPLNIIVWFTVPHLLLLCFMTMGSVSHDFPGPYHDCYLISQTNEEQNSLQQATLEPHSWFPERVATVRKFTLTPHNKGMSPWKFPKYKLLAIFREPNCNFLGQEFQGLR